MHMGQIIYLMPHRYNTTMCIFDLVAFAMQCHTRDKNKKGHLTNMYVNGTSNLHKKIGCAHKELKIILRGKMKGHYLF